MTIKFTVAALFILLFVLACSSGDHFIPGISPTVTPIYNPEGTPSMPIAITPDLPDGWRWQFSRGYPIPGMDAWLLLDDGSRTVGGIADTGNGCWIVLGDDVPPEGPNCYTRDEVGRKAVKILK